MRQEPGAVIVVLGVVIGVGVVDVVAVVIVARFMADHSMCDHHSINQSTNRKMISLSRVVRYVRHMLHMHVVYHPP